MRMISDTECQQMFLSLTVADLTSHLTAGTALLGPVVSELGRQPFPFSEA